MSLRVRLLAGHAPVAASPLARLHRSVPRRLSSSSSEDQTRVTRAAGVRILAAVFIVGAVALLAVAGSSAAADATVDVKNVKFLPASAQIEVDDSVTWHWISGTHSVVGDDDGEVWCSTRGTPSADCLRAFPTAGTFDYHCGVHGSAMTGSITVFDPNAPPAVTLGLTGSPMAEAAGAGTVTATLEHIYVGDVTVDLAFSGTATPTDDYTRSGTSIVVAAGSTTSTVTLTAVQDALDEAAETIIVDISGVTNGSESGTQQVTATITDDDAAPTVTLGLSDDPMAEAGGVATVTATLSGASGLDVTVNLGTSGTATLDTDYTRSGSSILISAGSTTGSITLTAVQDALDEADETAGVHITTVTNGDESGQQAVTETIVDDDAPPTVTLGIAGSPLAENAGAATVTATGSAASSFEVTVTLAFSGTATVTDDYARSGTSITITAGSTTGTVTLTGVDDGVDDDDETIVVDIDSVANGTEDSVQQVTATITDDDVPPDGDADGAPDATDNCPSDANADQLDTDADAAGDVCDADDDGDGASDVDEVAADSDPLDPLSTPEVCDGLDNDLDAATDEDFTDTDADDEADCVDPDDDGDGAPDADEALAGSDPLDGLSTPEVCDGLDNDLDTAVDEDPSGLDVCPPAWPVPVLTADADRTSADLAWSGAVDGFGVVAFHVYQDGVEILVVPATGTTATVTGLARRATYTFSIEAEDAVGLLSVDGPSLAVTTSGGGGGAPWNPPAPAPIPDLSGGEAEAPRAPTPPTDDGASDDASSPPQTPSTTPPPAPGAVDVSADVTVERVGDDNMVAWDEAPEGVLGFQVWRSNSPWILLADVPSWATSLVDEGAPEGSKYKVTAFTGLSVSAGHAAGPADLAFLPGWRPDVFAMAVPMSGTPPPTAPHGGPTSWLVITIGAALAAGAGALAAHVMFTARQGEAEPVAAQLEEIAQAVPLAAGAEAAALARAARPAAPAVSAAESLPLGPTTGRPALFERVDKPADGPRGKMPAPSTDAARQRDDEA